MCGVKRSRYLGLSLLLEMIVALAIMGGGVLVAMALFPTAYSSLGQAKNLTLANNLARQVLERQKALGYESLPAFKRGNVTLPVEVNGVTVNQIFLYECLSSLYADSSYKRVSVEVKWKVGQMTRSCRLDTVMVPR